MEDVVLQLLPEAHKATASFPRAGVLRVLIVIPRPTLTLKKRIHDTLRRVLPDVVREIDILLMREGPMRIGSPVKR